MGIGTMLIAGYTAYTAHRDRRQEKLEKKRARESVAKMKREQKAEQRAESKRQVEFFESKRKSDLARRQRTQRTFAGMQQEFNPTIMKQKLGQ